MRTDTVVAAEIRATRGKNEARRTRMRGMVPGVVYGAFQDPVSIAVNPKHILQILRSKTGHNTIFNVDVNGGENTPVMVVDEQYDPVKSHLLHVDLKRIDLSKRIKVTVPVVTEGDAKGIKLQGGLLEIVTRSIDIECVPDEIPQNFVIDVSDLMIGQSKRAGDIPMPGSMKLQSPADAVIAHVVSIRAVEEPVAAETAAPVAGAEPEVVKKGKKEEEAEAAETKGKKK
ncbi:MAG: 50S ribosomal protein L25 [Acidobacteriota bacterium]|nr:50S ribosomal protein L25 [Acidobacteriota bacterium]